MRAFPTGRPRPDTVSVLFAVEGTDFSFGGPNMKKVFLSAVFLVLLCTLASASGETLCVSPEGTGLTAALALSRDGDVIELAEGVYSEPNETFPLTVERSVTISAAPGARAVIDAPVMTSAFRVDADGVTLEGLTIALRRTGVTVTGDDFTMRNCAVTLADESRRTSSCGVWLSGAHRASLSGCAFTGCGVAMAGPPISAESEGKPVLTGLFEVGDDPAYFTSHTITDCTVNGGPLVYLTNRTQTDAPADAGEVILAGCEDMRLDHADVSDGSIGITLAYCDRVSVTDCTADRCGLFGVYCAYCDGCTLNGCSATGTNHGFDLRASTNMLVDGCEAINCAQGVFFSFMENSVMVNCTVKGTEQGCFLGGGSYNAVIDCEVADCDNGLNAQKENDLMIAGCTFTGNAVCAVRLDRSPATAADNVLESNWVGVMAYGNAAVTLTGNRFENSGSCGLYLKDIAFSRILNNVFTGGSNGGIQAYGELNGTTLDQNTLNVPPETE
jgi:parallel beta-helix repeat protein